MPEPTIVLEDLSPHGTLKAIVEDDGRVVTFYLWAGGDHYFGMRACWVCNRREAPQLLDKDAMREGTAPMLHRDACAHPSGMERPRDLRVTWLEEGDGAALLDEKGILCIIPGWSGINGFHGYARECTAQSPICWPLPPDDTLRNRIEKSDRFWKRWSGNAPWADFKASLSSSWQRALGPVIHEVDISQDVFPPRVVQHFRRDGHAVAATIGLSIRRQPRVEMAMKDPSRAVRIELACAVDDETLLAPITLWLRGTSGMPWNLFTWLGDGHTLPTTAVPGFPFMLLASDVPGAPSIALPDNEDGPRTALWVLPVTTEERAIAEKEGSRVLKERLWNSGVSHVFRRR